MKSKAQVVNDVVSSSPQKEWLKNVGEKRSKKKLLCVLVVAGGLLFSVVLFKDPIIEKLVSSNIPYVSEQAKKIFENSFIMLEEENEALLDLERQLRKAQEEIIKLKKMNSQYIDEVEMLKGYKEDFIRFETHKNEWDSAVAKENPKLYVEHFETIQPQTAAVIYEELKREEMQTEEEEEYIKVISGLKDRERASLLAELLKKNETLALKIFESLPIDKKTFLLDSLEKKAAVNILEKTNPFK